MTSWSETYRQRVTTAEEAARSIRSGDHVWVHAGCNNPEELVRAMVGRAEELRGVEVTHLMTFGCAPYAEPRHSASFRHRALFTGANVREAVNDGRADFVPVHLSEIPALLRTGDLEVDVALIHVAPPRTRARPSQRQIATPAGFSSRSPTTGLTPSGIGAC